MLSLDVSLIGNSSGSPYTVADEENTKNENSTTLLTQERAGNYVASFAINFYNNWSSKNHIYKDKEGEKAVKTK